MLKVKWFFVLLFCTLFFVSIPAAQQPELTLAYKDIGKPPYMERAPDNSGLYYDLISKAVQKTGLSLRVIRKPKKRIYEMLEQGEADLYASAEFRDYRSKFLFYIPNGLYRHERYVGMTAQNVPPLHAINEINQYKLRWIVELGSSWPRKAAYHNVPCSELKEITIEKAILLLQSDRPFFFQFIKEDLEKYMKQNAIKNWKSLGICIHEFCCEERAAPLYMNFSRHSPHYSEEINPAYDKEKPLNAENFPYRLVPGTVPYRLQEALREMRDSGEVDVLARKYFGNSWESIVH